MEKPQDVSEVDAGGKKIVKCIFMDFGCHLWVSGKNPINKTYNCLLLKIQIMPKLMQ